MSGRALDSNNRVYDEVSSNKNTFKFCLCRKLNNQGFKHDEAFYCVGTGHFQFNGR